MREGSAKTLNTVTKTISLMANRRSLHALTRRASALLSSTAPATPKPIFAPLAASKPIPILRNLTAPTRTALWPRPLSFSSDARGGDGEDDDSEDDEEEDCSDDEDCDGGDGLGLDLGREYTAEEKEAEAEAIGYKVIGPLHKDDRLFKPFKPVFAVVQIGSHQFKVSNDDCIFTEKLKFCQVNDKQDCLLFKGFQLVLTKVLLLGTKSQTIIGRPTLPEAAVHAVVEEHALDEKVIIFKKKRRKNYRRTKGHRQELTKLRITDIRGIEVPQKPKVPKKTVKKTITEKKAEEVPVAL